MSLSVYLWGIRLFTLLSLSVWLGMVMTIDPLQSGRAGIVFFFTSLFAFVLGITTLFVMWVYRVALGATSAAHHLGGAFRQALLLSCFFVGIIFFQKERILTWWDAALLLAVVLLIEFSLRRMFSQTVSD